MHQPFESVIGKSGVKTRSSEQSVLPVDADFLLVTDSSSEEDSERDDQSYLKEICPRGNNNVIILFPYIMINVYYSC